MTEGPRHQDSNAFIVKMLARRLLPERRKVGSTTGFQTLSADRNTETTVRTFTVPTSRVTVFEPTVAAESTEEITGADISTAPRGAENIPETEVISVDGTADKVKKPRFRIRKIADLRGPKAKWLSLRPFVKRRETPHCPYEMPVFRDPSRLQLEERNAARIKAIRETKPERNVRLAYAIEEVWEDVAAIRKDYLRRGSSASIGDIKYHDKGNYEGVEKLTNEEAKREPFESGDTYTPTELILAQKKILEVTTRNWFNAKDKLLFGKQETEWTDEGRDFQRLSELVGLINTSRYEDSFEPTNAYSLIEQGFNNAVLLQWGLFTVSHEAFEDTKKRKATKREVASMYASSTHIATSMAIGHLQITFPFRNHLAPNINNVAMTFNKDDFIVREVPDPEKGDMLPILDIKPESFEAFEEKFEDRLQHPDPEKPLNRLDEVTTGCPAIYAQGQGESTEEEREAQENFQHVVSELAQWSYQIATELSEDYLNAPDTIEESLALSAGSSR